MQIIEKGNFFYIYVSHSQRIENDIRMIPGRIMDYEKKTWKVPVSKLSRIHVESFAKKHGVKITVPESQKKLQLNNKQSPMPTLNIPDSELKKLFKLMPYDYQKAGIAYGLKHKRAINGDAPGLGKTAQSICTVTIANKFPNLVICPAGLKDNWKEEWEMWTDKRVVILNNAVQHFWYLLAQGLDLFGQKSAPVKVFVTNYESLRKYFVIKINKPAHQKKFSLKQVIFSKYIRLFQSVIIDESHRLKDPTTQQTIFSAGISHGKTHILELTGTPIVNKTEDLIAQLGVIGRMDLFGGVSGFKNTYCRSKQEENDYEELNRILNNNCYFRREKKDVLKELPDKTRQIVRCEINNKEEYNAAVDDLENYLREYRKASESEIMRSLRGEVMVRIGILKNISARGKVEAVMEHIDDVLESGEKLVVFIYLKEVAEIFRKRYPNALFYTGEQNNREKQAAKQKFQECKVCGVKHEHHKKQDHEFVPSDYNLIFVNYKAGGVGITLTAAYNLFVVEWPWHPADTDQLEDRCHRNGQANAVLCRYFLGKGTFDQQSYSIIENKRALGNAITGARNDVEVAVLDYFFNGLVSNEIVIQKVS